MSWPSRSPPGPHPTLPVKTPEAPESLDELLRSPHNPAAREILASPSSSQNPASRSNTSGLIRRDESRWSGFRLSRTEQEQEQEQGQDHAILRRLSQGSHPSASASAWLRSKLASSAPATLRGRPAIYRQDSLADSRTERLFLQDDRINVTEPKLTTFGLIALTISLAGAQLAWTLELAYGTPYLLSLGLSEQSTSLVWLAGPLSGLIAQPVIGSLSDASTSRFRRRRYMILSASLLTISTIVLAFSVPISTAIVDTLRGGLADWDPRRHELVQYTTQWISIAAFWILDFALNGLQASSRALILDTAPSQQQSVANAWHGRMTHAGNVVGYLCGWLDLASWRGLRWLGGGQFRRFAIVSLAGMITCVTVTVTTIDEKASSTLQNPQEANRVRFWTQARETIDNVWQAIRRLPRPVRRVCIVQLFAFMGWFPFLFYGTTYVLQIADANDHHKREINGNATTFTRAKDDKEEHHGMDSRAEMGSFAMLLFAIVALCSGALLPYLSLARERSNGGIALEEDADDASQANGGTTNGSIAGDVPVSDLEASLLAVQRRPKLTFRQRVRRSLRHGLTLRTFWTLASLTFSLLMAATFFVSDVRGATTLIALVGLPWSVASWVPFAMVAEFVREAEEGQSPFEFEGDHWSPKRTRARQVQAERRNSLREITQRDRVASALTECQPLPSSEPGTEEVKFGGTILGIHNLAIVAPQFVVAIISSLIFSAVDHRTDNDVPGVGVTWVLRFGGAMAICAAAATRLVPLTLTERIKRGVHSPLQLPDEDDDEDEVDE